MLTGAPTSASRAVLIGREGTGKTSLAHGWTRRTGADLPLAVAGSTITCATYERDGLRVIDTPGLVVGADVDTLAQTIKALPHADITVVVVRATHLTEDCAAAWPLAVGRRGLLVVSNTDRVHALQLKESLPALAAAAGVPVVGADLRTWDLGLRQRLAEAKLEYRLFRAVSPDMHIAPLRPSRNWFAVPVVGPLLAFIAMLTPAWIAVEVANRTAALIEPLVAAAMQSPITIAMTWPEPLATMLTGRYGLLTMGPLMLVWAMPTVLVFTVLLATAKASGLLEHCAAAIHPWLAWCGLGGRDLVRVVMGFGCNVPAVIATRSCSTCTRDACIHAIAFGAACSYQFGATLAVFAAAGRPWLVWPYLGWLTCTTLIYTRWVNGRSTIASSGMVFGGISHLEWPRLGVVLRESLQTVRAFVLTAMPIFLIIALIAAGADWLGLLTWLSHMCSPALMVVGLPPEAMAAVVLATIRKDGILLFAEPQLATSLSAAQLLAGTYLAGVLLPCLVTTWTIARERSVAMAVRLLARQAAAALVFTVLLVWVVMPAATVLATVTSTGW